MESERYERAQEVQHLNSAAHDEAAQLQAMIRCLREQLEQVAFQGTMQKQEAIAAAANEIKELRAVCQALRDELDRARGNSP
jgi:hypothetical protein